MLLSLQRFCRIVEFVEDVGFRAFLNYFLQIYSYTHRIWAVDKNELSEQVCQFHYEDRFA